MTPYELAQRIGFLLSQKKLKLAIVESCTGGSLAKLVTDVPGASEWFDCGFITYSNESKIRSVNVPEELIAQNGAVSQKVALAMAKGGLDVTNADIVISTTGIAGRMAGHWRNPLERFVSGSRQKKVISVPINSYSTEIAQRSGKRA